MTYRLCDQTVTVYRKEAGTINRRVVRRAYMDFDNSREVGKDATKYQSGCTLIVPTSDPLLRPGDKVIRGEGPVIGADDWPTFVPSKVAGLCVIESVSPKYHRGKQVHEEAQG